MKDTIGINDPKPHAPSENVCVICLYALLVLEGGKHHADMAYFNVNPRLLLKRLQLLHESLLRHSCGFFLSKKCWECYPEMASLEEESLFARGDA